MKKNTTAFYNEIWQGFGKQQCEEATQLLFKRWTINKIPFSILEEKKVLDVGCGSGRYSRALLQLGAKEVVGVDAHKPAFEATGFSFKKGSVLALPFKENEFDFVFCNGVLHHTKNWQKGISEMARVLKPNGWLWLYVATKHWSWALADKIRNKCSQGDAQAFQKYLKARGWPPNKIFFLEDCFFAPHRVYLAKTEVEWELTKNSFLKPRFLTKDVERMNIGLRCIAKKKF